MIKKINFNISPLGFGTLTLGPYQKNFPVDRGANLIVHAIKRGINVIDTADLYMTYPYIREALKKIEPGIRKNIVIMSRSYNYTYEGMEKSFNKACVEMGVERIPVFMLHEMESELTLKGHSPALKYLFEMKTQGKIDMTGISTHYIGAVRAAADHPDIDCIFAILNRRGLGIMDGNTQEMESALSQAHDKGKTIFIMKAIGGGHFFREAEESLAYVRDLPFVDSVIVGMQSVEEIECNIRITEAGSRKSEVGGRICRRDVPIPINELRITNYELRICRRDVPIPINGSRRLEVGSRKSEDVSPPSVPPAGGGEVVSGGEINKTFLYKTPEEHKRAKDMKLSDKQYFVYKKELSAGSSPDKAIRRAKETMPGELSAEPRLKDSIPRPAQTDFTDDIKDIPAREAQYIHGVAEKRPGDFRRILKDEVLPGEYKFESPDGTIKRDIYFAPDSRSVERLGEEGALNNYTDHLISSEGKYRGIRHFHYQRARLVSLIPDLLRDPDMILKNESGREFFVRKYKGKKKDEFHLFVGEVGDDGRIRGITAYPKGKKLKLDAGEILYKSQTAPSPESSSVGAGLAVPGPATPSKDIISQPGTEINIPETESEPSPTLPAPEVGGRKPEIVKEAIETRGVLDPQEYVRKTFPNGKVYLPKALPYFEERNIPVKEYSDGSVFVLDRDLKKAVPPGKVEAGGRKRPLIPLFETDNLSFFDIANEKKISQMGIPYQKAKDGSKIVVKKENSLKTDSLEDENKLNYYKENIDTAKKLKDKKFEFDIGEIDDSAKDSISNFLGKGNIDNKVSLTDSALRHIENKNEDRDLFMVPEILENYDRLIYSRTKGQEKGFNFIKFVNGYNLVLETKYKNGKLTVKTFYQIPKNFEDTIRKEREISVLVDKKKIDSDGPLAHPNLAGGDSGMTGARVESEDIIAQKGTEINTLETEGGGRKSDVGSRRSDVGSRKSEVGDRMSEVGGRRPDYGDRKLLIEDYCRGCGECEKACPFGAIRVIDGKARVDHDKCMLCSYCAYKCPEFCIKVI